jgi:hypothetical protein
MYEYAIKKELSQLLLTFEQFKLTRHDKFTQSQRILEIHALYMSFTFTINFNDANQSDFYPPSSHTNSASCSKTRVRGSFPVSLQWLRVWTRDVG